MSTINNLQAKTLGARSAGLVAALYEEGMATFDLEDVRRITGLAATSARTLIFKMKKRGWVTPLKAGLFSLVPLDMGNSTEFVGSPYEIARRLADPESFFVSHGAAMDIHGMSTQPYLTYTVSVTARRRSQRVSGYRFQFIQIRPDHLFGIEKHWYEKSRSTPVSNVERTVIDGLRQPQFCGGVTEVAKGLWLKAASIRIDTLIEYADLVDSDAVRARLGHLLELYEMATPDQLAMLRRRLKNAYRVLDPTMPAAGPFRASWRLQHNIPDEELKAVRFG